MFHFPQVSYAEHVLIEIEGQLATTKNHDGSGDYAYHEDRHDHDAIYYCLRQFP